MNESALENADRKELFDAGADAESPAPSKHDRWISMVQIVVTGIATALTLNQEARAWVVVTGLDSEHAYVTKQLQSLSPSILQRVSTTRLEGRVFINPEQGPNVFAVLPSVELA